MFAFLLIAAVIDIGDPVDTSNHRILSRNEICLQRVDADSVNSFVPKSGFFAAIADVEILRRYAGSMLKGRGFGLRLWKNGRMTL